MNHDQNRLNSESQQSILNHQQLQLQLHHQQQQQQQQQQLSPSSQPSLPYFHSAINNSISNLSTNAAVKSYLQSQSTSSLPSTSSSSSSSSVIDPLNTLSRDLVHYSLANVTPIITATAPFGSPPVFPTTSSSSHQHHALRPSPLNRPLTTSLNLKNLSNCPSLPSLWPNTPDLSTTSTVTTPSTQSYSPLHTPIFSTNQSTLITNPSTSACSTNSTTNSTCTIGTNPTTTTTTTTTAAITTVTPSMSTTTSASATASATNQDRLRSTDLSKCNLKLTSQPYYSSSQTVFDSQIGHQFDSQPNPFASGLISPAHEHPPNRSSFGLPMGSSQGQTRLNLRLDHSLSATEIPEEQAQNHNTRFLRSASFSNTTSPVRLNRTRTNSKASSPGPSLPHHPSDPSLASHEPLSIELNNQHYPHGPISNTFISATSIDHDCPRVHESLASENHEQTGSLLPSSLTSLPPPTPFNSQNQRGYFDITPSVQTQSNNSTLQLTSPHSSHLNPLHSQSVRGFDPANLIELDLRYHAFRSCLCGEQDVMKIEEKKKDLIRSIEHLVAFGVNFMGQITSSNYPPPPNYNTILNGQASTSSGIEKKRSGEKMESETNTKVARPEEAISSSAGAVSRRASIIAMNPNGVPPPAEMTKMSILSQVGAPTLCHTQSTSAIPQHNNFSTTTYNPTTGSGPAMVKKRTHSQCPPLPPSNTSTTTTTAPPPSTELSPTDSRSPTSFANFSASTPLGLSPVLIDQKATTTSDLISSTNQMDQLMAMDLDSSSLHAQISNMISNLPSVEATPGTTETVDLKPMTTENEPSTKPSVVHEHRAKLSMDSIDSNSIESNFISTSSNTRNVNEEEGFQTRPPSRISGSGWNHEENQVIIQRVPSPPVNKQMGAASAGVSDELAARFEPIFTAWLGRLCSDLDMKDSKGEPIHQTLMARKMQRLEESVDFRPFKFRIQAFTNAFFEELIRHGFNEKDLPMKKVRQYLWSQTCISRFNEEGKKAKSKGNHVWHIEAQKIVNGQWNFLHFQRKIVGSPPSVAYMGKKWIWIPKIWDPQCSAHNIRAIFSCNGQGKMPNWLSWKDNTLSGIVPEDEQELGKVYVFGVLATTTHNSRRYTLETEVKLEVRSAADENAGSSSSSVGFDPTLPSTTTTTSTSTTTDSQSTSHPNPNASQSSSTTSPLNRVPPNLSTSSSSSTTQDQNPAMYVVGNSSRRHESYFPSVEEIGHQVRLQSIRNDLMSHDELIMNSADCLIRKAIASDDPMDRQFAADVLAPLSRTNN